MIEQQPVRPNGKDNPQVTTSERPMDSFDPALAFEEDKALERVVLTRLMRMNATIQGLVIGLLAGFAVFIATIWLVIKGGPMVGLHLSLLSNYFIGYSVSYVGSVVGFAYAGVGGFIVGYVIAIVYNWMIDLRYGKNRKTEG